MYMNARGRVREVKNFTEILNKRAFPVVPNWSDKVEMAKVF